MVEKSEIQIFDGNQECKGELIIRNNKTGVVDVPKGIIDKAVVGLKTLIETKENLRAAKNAGEEVFKVIIKPELQAGLMSGELTWDSCSALLKRVDNNRIAGQIKVEKFEIDGISKAQAVASGITKLICSASGQIQIAEINKKLDKLQETIDQIREESWRDRISELNALSFNIRSAHAQKFLHQENARTMIIDSITKVGKHVEFFKQSIEKELVKKIQLKFSNSIWETIKYWFVEQKNDYNDTYINEVKVLLGDYSFLLDLYLEAQELQYICYQYIGEYPIAEERREIAYRFIYEKNTELFKKVMYCFDLVDTTGQYTEHLFNLIPLLESQGINISEDLKEADNKITINNDTFGTNAEIIVTIPISLLEVGDDD